MKEIQIGDTLVVIVTGNAKNPICTKTEVKDIVYSFDSDIYGIVVTDIADGPYTTVGILLNDISKDDEGNWCCIKEIK